ncbi:DUF4830 domain-containing protein [Marasmitruncus massiliensis]|jgi:hypothetical protein|uniref:DUF4830 domain-containing protein n=1 Tax=Marasmitruncus massiliensis TaxID=1944642 RepID=UPI000C79F87C|nr:DUF4830 domain-containing protein [Marasmitruncus massiliensis]MBE6907748.1 DUF4830 domain-containing protein [Oscillospiraceae bacterium]
MFTISVRITKKQIAVAAAVFIIALAGGIGVNAALSKLSAAPPKETTEAVKIEKAAGKTNDQRVEFLKSFGWEVNPEEVEIMEVLIPKEVDEVFANYNDIQKQQGCDMSKYAGKRCKRYSYTVLNYPDGSEDVRANVIVYNGKIIGGDVCSTKLDGFMHGFAIEND